MYERRDNYEFWRSLAEGVFDEETVQKYWSWQTTEEAYDAMLAPQGTSARDAITNPVFNPSPEEWHKMSDPKTGELYGFGTPTGKVELVLHHHREASSTSRRRFRTTKSPSSLPCPRRKWPRTIRSS